MAARSRRSLARASTRQREGVNPAAMTGSGNRQSSPSTPVLERAGVIPAEQPPRSGQRPRRPRGARRPAAHVPIRSTAANATSPSTPPACCWKSSSRPHPSKTATPPGRCCSTSPAPTAASAAPGPHTLWSYQRPDHAVISVHMPGCGAIGYLSSSRRAPRAREPQLRATPASCTLTAACQAGDSCHSR